MRIVDCIAECDDGKSRVIDPSRRRSIVVHRSGMGPDAQSIAAAFRAPGEPGVSLGHQMPYTFCIGSDGTVEQALRMGDWGPHARGWNVSGIGIAVIGDMRMAPCPPLQYESLVLLSAALVGWTGRSTAVHGHDELRVISGGRIKGCPGQFLNMDMLREDIREFAKTSLESLGAVF